MPRLYPAKIDFSKGELDPLLHSRSDLAAWRSGVAKMENFIPDPIGPAVKRTGSEFISSISGFLNSNVECKLFKLQQSQHEFYTVAVFKDFIYVYASNGPLASYSFISNGYFNSSLSSSTAWTSVVGAGASVIENPGHITVVSGVDVSDTVSLRHSAISISSPSQAHTIEIKILEPNASTNGLRLRIGTAAGLGDILDNLVPNISNIFYFVPGVASIHVSLYMPGSNAGTRNLDAVVLFDSLGGTYVRFTSPWTDGLNEIQEMSIQSSNGYIYTVLVHPRVLPQNLLFYGPGSVSFGAATITAKPASWVAGNSPSVIEFHAGRMWLSGVESEPGTIWGSKIVPGTFVANDFTLGVAATDALQFTIQDRSHVKWINGTRDLLVGTSNFEYVVSAQGGVIHAGDVSSRKQSGNGSHRHKPVAVDSGILTVSKSRKSIHLYRYTWESQSWTSEDITVFWGGLFNSNIKEVVHVGKTSSQFFVLLESGNVLFGQYKKELDSIGWSKVVTNGKVLSMAGVDDISESAVYMVVDRKNPGQLALEKHMGFGFHGAYIDSHVHKVNIPSSVNFSVPHLAFKTVTIVADGNVHPDVVLDATGNGVLGCAASIVTVGLKYKGLIKLLPMDNGAPGGSSFEWTKKWNQLFVRLFNSTLPRINGVDPIERNPSTPMGTSELPATQDLKMNMLGYDNCETLIEHDHPTPCNITGIFGTITSNTL